MPVLIRTSHDPGHTFSISSSSPRAASPCGARTRINNIYPNSKPDGSTRETNGVPTIVHDALKSSGQPLVSNTRAFFERRLGMDFSAVRVHTDSKASESARAVNALAYTVGREIVFDSGQYAPETSTGEHLLAHELTHVVQQHGQMENPMPTLHVGPVNDSYEREADYFAARVVADLAVPRASLSSLNETRIQRAPTFSAECDEFRRCQVVEPLMHARQLVDAVLNALPPVVAGGVTTGRIVDLVNVHFHNPSDPAGAAATVLPNFQQIRAELDAQVHYVCHNDIPNDCEATATGFVGGYTGCTPGSDVHLCPAYYTSIPCPEQARILVHENAHHVLGCQDFAYVHEAGYMALPFAQASRNPDTYAQFAKMVSMSTPSCVNCSEEIQRSGQRRHY